MAEKNKYETTLDVFEEWKKTPGEKLWDHSFVKFLTEKTKPEDPLFEKWTTAPKEIFQNFALFKEYFADDLNGTRGLDEAITFFKGAHTIVISNVMEKLKEIKAKLEKGE